MTKTNEDYFEVELTRHISRELSQGQMVKQYQVEVTAMRLARDYNMPYEYVVQKIIRMRGLKDAVLLERNCLLLD